MIGGVWGDKRRDETEDPECVPFRLWYRSPTCEAPVSECSSGAHAFVGTAIVGAGGGEGGCALDDGGVCCVRCVSDFHKHARAWGWGAGGHRRRRWRTRTRTRTRMRTRRCWTATSSAVQAGHDTCSSIREWAGGRPDEAPTMWPHGLMASWPRGLRAARPTFQAARPSVQRRGRARPCARSCQHWPVPQIRRRTWADGQSRCCRGGCGPPRALYNAACGQLAKGHRRCGGHPGRLQPSQPHSATRRRPVGSSAAASTVARTAARSSSSSSSSSGAAQQLSTLCAWPDGRAETATAGRPQRPWCRSSTGVVWRRLWRRVSATSDGPFSAGPDGAERTVDGRVQRGGVRHLHREPVPAPRLGHKRATAVSTAVCGGASSDMRARVRKP